MNEDKATRYNRLKRYVGIAAVAEGRGSGRCESGFLVLGTPAYVAPERLRARAFDHRVDAYALGVTLYEVLCGSPPFGGSDPSEAMRRALAAEYVPVSRKVDLPLGGRIDRLIAEMLASDPVDRPPSMKAIRAYLVHLRQQLHLPTRRRSETAL